MKHASKWTLKVIGEPWPMLLGALSRATTTVWRGQRREKRHPSLTPVLMRGNAGPCGTSSGLHCELGMNVTTNFNIFTTSFTVRRNARYWEETARCHSTT